MFETKTAAKWLERVKRNALMGFLEKPYKRVFKKPSLNALSASFPAEALREQKIQRLELERVKTRAFERVRRSQIR